MATKCDAGMCKLAFHVTCAQAQGLLVDDSWGLPGQSSSAASAAGDIAPPDQRCPPLCP